MKKKSHTGTTTTTASSTSPYSVAELCEIIASCRKNGVWELKVPGVSLVFGEKAAENGHPKPRRSPKEAEKAKKLEEEAFLDQEAKTREEYLAHMRLADPLAYEELISQGELEHAGEKSEQIGVS